MRQTRHAISLQLTALVLLLAALSWLSCRAPGDRYIRHRLLSPRPPPLLVSGPGGQQRLKEWRAGFHVHSEHSHDSVGTLGEIMRDALRAGLDVIVTTDHNSGALTRELPLQSHPLVVVGSELSTNHGHLIALGTGERRLPHGIAPIVLARQVRALGGVTILAHPNPWGRRGWKDMSIIDHVDGLEITNTFTDLLDSGVGSTLWRAFTVFTLGGRPGSAALSLRHAPMIDLYDRLIADGRRLSIVAGMDAHGEIPAGGRQLLSYAALFNIGVTHLYTPELNESAILEAIRRGRAHLGFDALAPTRGFRFVARSETRTEVSGGALPLPANGDPATLEVWVPPPRRAHIRVFHRGRLVAEAHDARHLELAADQPGPWRVECSLDLGPGLGSKAWIISNPIYLEAQGSTAGTGE